jgi:DNA-directed RNA polymerase specialized sigma24 family protein
MPSRAFEDTVLPHLDTAFNYARWLTRDDAEAEDMVQDACVRAMRFFSSLRDYARSQPRVHRGSTHTPSGSSASSDASASITWSS